MSYVNRHRSLGSSGSGGDRSDVRSPTRTSTEVRSPTSTSTEVRSPTSTSTEVRSPTSTSTDAYTSGNVTVTGGAGAGATTSVTIHSSPPYETVRADAEAHRARSAGSASRMPLMIRSTMAPRARSPMPATMRSTMGPRAPLPGMMSRVHDGGVALGDVFDALTNPLVLIAGGAAVWWWMKRKR